jgi:hypothetical protein
VTNVRRFDDMTKRATRRGLAVLRHADIPLTSQMPHDEAWDGLLLVARSSHNDDWRHEACHGYPDKLRRRVRRSQAGDGPPAGEDTNGTPRLRARRCRGMQAGAQARFGVFPPRALSSAHTQAKGEAATKWILPVCWNPSTASKCVCLSPPSHDLLRTLLSVAGFWSMSAVCENSSWDTGRPRTARHANSKAPREYNETQHWACLCLICARRGRLVLISSHTPCQRVPRHVLVRGWRDLRP